MKLGLTILMTTFLFACSFPDRQFSSVEDQSKVDTVEHEYEKMMVFSHDYLTQKGDSIEIPWFEISVELSDKAEQRIAATNETIIVAAYFNGRPTDKIPEKLKEYIAPVEGVRLSSCYVELTEPGIAKFNKVRFHRKLYDLLADKDIELLINIYSGRKAGPNNILSGDILQDKMSNVAGKTFKLTERLIEEEL